MKQDDHYHLLAGRFGPMIERLARGYERDPERARDLVQSIHVELWRSLASFDGQCSEQSWVYRIGHNVGVSHMIREARSHRADWVGLDEVELATGEQAEARIDREARQARLLAMIHQLKPTDRQVMLLTLEELTATEIGDILGLSAGAVAVRLSRAKVLLAKMAGEAR